MSLTISAIHGSTGRFSGEDDVSRRQQVVMVDEFVQEGVDYETAVHGQAIRIWFATSAQPRISRTISDIYHIRRVERFIVLQHRLNTSGEVISCLLYTSPSPRDS